MNQRKLRDKLGRMDTRIIEFGEHRLFVKPDRSGDGQAIILLMIRGPGIPNLHIQQDRVRQLADSEIDDVPAGYGSIVFERTDHVRLRIPVN